MDSSDWSNGIRYLRDSCPCVVKNKPYGSSNGLICMAQGQRSGIEGVMMTCRYQISDLAPYRKGDFLTIQGPESRSHVFHTRSDTQIK